MTIDIEVMKRILDAVYNPPVRGLTSKKSRIRKKADKNLKKTLRGQVYNPNFAISKIGEVK